jgi:hypothetical protein
VHREHNLGVRTPRRFAWLNIANGLTVVALMCRWARTDGDYDLLDAATIWTLMIGFLMGIPAALQSLRTLDEQPQDAGRIDALLLFPAEAPGPGPFNDVDDVDGGDPADTDEADRRLTRAMAGRLAWFTIAMHGVLMIALSWRWAFRDQPYTSVDAVTLSMLMMGFVGASATIVTSLGRPARSRSTIKRKQPEALSLFPAEDSATHELTLTRQVLATSRKALL